MSAKNVSFYGRLPLFSLRMEIELRLPITKTYLFLCITFSCKCKIVCMYNVHLPLHMAHVSSCIARTNMMEDLDVRDPLLHTAHTTAKSPTFHTEITRLADICDVTSKEQSFVLEDVRLM